MRHWMFFSNVACLLLATAWALPAASVTYLDDCAHNGVVLKSELTIGYQGPGGTTGTFVPGFPPPALDLVVSSPPAQTPVVNPAPT